MLGIVSRSDAATFSLGKKLGQSLQEGVVLAFDGQLGAGKTVFAKGLAEGLGVKAVVTSPTFILMEQYQGRLPFIHIDAYRIVGDEAEEAGIADALRSDAVVFVEWAKNIEDYLPRDTVRCAIEVHLQPDGETRELRFFALPQQEERLKEIWQ